MAAFVFLARPDRAQNRLLALALLLDGLNWTMLAARVAAERPDVATAALVTQITFLAARTFAYLAFLGTLETPLVRPLRGPGALGVLGGMAVASAAVIAVQPQLFYPDSLTSAPTPWRWTPASLGPGVFVILLVDIAVLAFALVAAVHTWARTPRGSATRSRAGWYATAFAVRDGALLVNWVSQFVHIQHGVRPALTAWGRFEMVLLPVSFLAFCALVAYGIFRHQLFDIDLRIKWTIKQSTVALVFMAVFLAVTEGAQVVFGDENPWVGIGAAALLVFALAPLQRFAERVSDVAMPHVNDTDEYRGRRAREIYQAAIESALEDGTVTERERGVLATLADQLGLSSKEALDLEREVAMAREVT